MVIAISAVMNLSSGQALSSAVLGAFSQIRPVEYVMYFAFWYWKLGVDKLPSTLRSRA